MEPWVRFQVAPHAFYQEEIAEAKWAADLNNTYEKDIITQEKHFELIRRTKLLGILKGLLYIV